nr:MAG TPA: hypothetical protein [Caudoviricetes sp.]
MTLQSMPKRHCNHTPSEICGNLIERKLFL